MASDPTQGKILSAQVLSANRRGIDPIIELDNKKIKLVRISS